VALGNDLQTLALRAVGQEWTRLPTLTPDLATGEQQAKTKLKLGVIDGQGRRYLRVIAKDAGVHPLLFAGDDLSQDC
jgi:hypothetical protein